MVRNIISLEGKEIFYHITYDSSFVAKGMMNNEGCFIYSLSSRASMFSQSSSVELSDGQSAVMKCGNYINSWMANEDGEKAEFILIKLYPELMRKVFESIEVKLPSTTSVVSSQLIVEKNEAIQKYIESLLFYFSFPNLMQDEIAFLKLKELVLLLLSLPNYGPLSDLVHNMFKANEMSLAKIVDTHITNNLTMEELAHLSNMSKSTFQRKFKQETGHSPKQYIIVKRIEMAKKLFKSTSLSITDVGYECGFVDMSHFSKSFKKLTGHSPRDYISTS